MKASPLVILSFNRPNYLEALLHSLLQQIGANLEHRVIVLFQDGILNPYDDETLASQQDIDSCLQIFRQLIPWGEVYCSVQNLGVAMNFDRAEKYVFEYLDAASAIFLEDDLLLSEYYINVLDHLLAVFENDDRVGYISAYGDHELPIELQVMNRNKLMALHHNWAFAVYKRQWLRIRPYVESYLDCVRGRRYAMRDHDAISKLFLSWGYGTPGTSQDCAKTIACVATKTLKINTVACFGRYIGEQGLHMDPLLFKKRKYDETQVMRQLVTDFEAITTGLSQTVFQELEDWAGTSSRTNNEYSTLATMRSLTRMKLTSDNTQKSFDTQIASSWKNTLYRYFEGASLRRRLEKLFHVANDHASAGVFERAYLTAANAIVGLLENVMPEKSVFVAFYPTRNIRDVDHESHVRIDLRGLQLRVICPTEMLASNFTNYFEAFVLLAVLLKTVAPEKRDTGGFTMDMGNGSDSGDYSRVAFSSGLSRAHLIVDPECFFSDGYKSYRESIKPHWTPWKERHNIAYWRGKTTGIATAAVQIIDRKVTNWTWLQRLDLCHKLKLYPNHSAVDVGVTEVVQIQSDDIRQSIIDSDLMRAEKKDWAIIGYRFVFVVDGNSSVDNDLLKSMLSGCCIFLVESNFGFKSWFYDKLEPWVTHIPIEKDLCDLSEKLDWAFSHLNECEQIAQESLHRGHLIAVEAENAFSREVITLS